MKPFAPFLLLLSLLFAVSGAIACSAMGKNTHVGQIIGVDKAAGTLTIQDAETRKPITFILKDQLLIEAASAQGQVIVHYNGEENGKLVATDIQ